MSPTMIFTLGAVAGACCVLITQAASHAWARRATSHCQAPHWRVIEGE